LLFGKGVSAGIVIGTGKIKRKTIYEITTRSITNIDEEIEKINQALLKSKTQLKKIYAKTKAEIGENEAEIFNAHLAMLNDQVYIDGIIEIVTQEKTNAENAVDLVTNKYMDLFNKMDDPYLKERAIDLNDVSMRLIKNIMGVESSDFSNLTEDIIILADDLTPSDTAQLDKKHVIGFITEEGGKTSHTAIMARTLEIPAVVAISDLLTHVKDNDTIIMDGESGRVYINPDSQTQEIYSEKRCMFLKQKEMFKRYVNLNTKTKDDKTFELASNIGTLSDLDLAIENGSEGIGLFRTELFYLDKTSLPTEEEQFEIYKKIAVKMEQKPVVIRTLDIGGDKEIPYLNIPKEMNPFLGFRAIRFCLERQDVFRTQLRALLRASAYGNIKIMFPMISSMHELLDAKKIIEEIEHDLDKEKILFNRNIEVGMMIEIPSAAIMSDQFAKEVDFFSIGTNDLIQYTVAVDRGNTMISNLYTEFNPAVLRLINTVIKNAHHEGIWVGMCGEAASNSKLLPLLIAMGLDEFSMNSSMIPQIRCAINNMTYHETKELLNVLDLSNSNDIIKILDEFSKK
jgi:phosphotransferase system enzyme I (PtsI)